MTTDAEASPPDEASHPDELSREEVASTEIDWDDIDKASHQAHALLRDLAGSTVLADLLTGARQDLPRRLVEVDGAERVILLSPADRDWVLEILLGADAPSPDPATPSAEYSVLSLRGGFEFTIFHLSSADDGELVPSVTRFEQPGSCYTSSATVAQVLDTTSDTVALVLRRRAAQEVREPAPERVANALSRLTALGALR